MERPGLVGPMGETLVMDVDPESEMIVYRVHSNSSPGAQTGDGAKSRRRSSLEAASKMYKQAKELLVNFIQAHRKSTSTSAHRRDTDLMEDIDEHDL